ncbi:hypothetical protein BDV36DRAFT_261029 [Aspergillus pseudocaelatus]|uniref:Uncharacterized protein n=1 Tax=Aspergillus pseudocaelatus TaxID=1825620 RepID=A0ABQ6WKQ1_9EURO|nr:hypothetical protein BDV36DRAFT_261029 [Aspergillus pseudocaelatus]
MVENIYVVSLCSMEIHWYFHQTTYMNKIGPVTEIYSFLSNYVVMSPNPNSPRHRLRTWKLVYKSN